MTPSVTDLTAVITYGRVSYTLAHTPSQREQRDVSGTRQSGTGHAPLGTCPGRYVHLRDGFAYDPLRVARHCGHEFRYWYV